MRTALLAGFFACAPGMAAAQSIEIFATTGVVQVWDDEGNIGLGAPIGVGIGLRSPHGWGIEALVETQKAKRTFSSDVRFDSTVTAGRARLLKYFGSGSVQPYAGVGLGVTRVRSTRDYPADCSLTNNVFRCTSRDVFTSESTAGTLSGSTGLRIAVGRKMFVRPEFEISKSGEHLRLGGVFAIGASW